MDELILDKIKRRNIKALEERKGRERSVLSFLQSLIEKEEKDQNKRLDDKETISILVKHKKTLQGNIELAKRISRADIIKQNSEELEIIEEYLPKMLTEEETRIAIEEVIKEVDAKNIKDMKSVMNKIKEYENIDIGLAGRIAKEKLTVM